MNLLNIDNSKYSISFNMPDQSKIQVNNITRDDLLKLMNKIYEDSSYYDFTQEEEISTFENDMLKSMTEQIYKGLIDFKNNIIYIKKDIEDSFPSITTHL